MNMCVLYLTLTKQSWKCKRSKCAPMRGFMLSFWRTIE